MIKTAQGRGSDLPKSRTGITDNVRSLGLDLNTLVAKKQILLNHVHIERREIEETGEYDLEGLCIRLGHAMDAIGAQRVVLDTIEALFAGRPGRVSRQQRARHRVGGHRQKHDARAGAASI